MIYSIPSVLKKFHVWSQQRKYRDFFSRNVYGTEDPEVNQITDCGIDKTLLSTPLDKTPVFASPAAEHLHLLNYFNGMC